MAVLVRVTDFIPNTLIKSQEVDDELNQLVNLLSGVSTNKDTLLKYNHATDPVLRVDQLGAGLIQRWLNNGVERATLSALGKLLLPAGIGATPSTDKISNFGVYASDAQSRVTGANTTETDLTSRTLSANVMANDNDFIVGLATVDYGANANTKRYRIYFGGNVFYDTGAVAFNGVSQMILFIFGRITSTTLRGVFLSLFTNAGAGSTIQTANNGAISFTGTNILKSTGQNGAAVANDVFQTNFILLKGSV